MKYTILNTKLFAVLLSVLVFACNKVDTTIKQNKPSWESLTATGRHLASMLFDSSTVHNAFVLTYSEMTGYTPKYDVGYGVYFTDSVTNNQIGFKSASVNGVALTASADSSESYKFPDTLATQAAAIAATTLSVKIAGTSSSDTVTEAVYVPKGIVASPTDFPGGSIISGQTLTLKWNTDPNCSWGNVLIVISYLSGLSHYNDHTLPANVDSLVITAPDNGSYTVSTAQLQAFPVNSYIDIAIGRGTQQKAILPVSHKALYYFTIVEARTGAIMVTNIQ